MKVLEKIIQLVLCICCYFHYNTLRTKATLIRNTWDLWSVFNTSWDYASTGCPPTAIPWAIKHCWNVSILNPLFSLFNFFAFFTAISMFSTQNSLDNCSQYYVCSKKLCFQTRDARPSTFQNLWRPVRPFPMILLANVALRSISYNYPCLQEVWTPERY